MNLIVEDNIRLYRGNNNLKRVGEVIEFTKEQLLEYVKCENDIVYFAEKYCKIVTLNEGLTNIKLYEYQKDVLKNFQNNRFNVLLWPRQSAKTTVVMIFITWMILFNDYYVCGLLAHKEAQSKEILKRIKTAYEYLPKWLQQGVTEWNKTSISLENGSSVMAAATSPEGITGRSLNLLYLDEFAKVQQNIADDFMASAVPTISQGTDSKIIISSTPKGLNHFHKLWNDAVKGISEYVPHTIKWNDVPGRNEAFKEKMIKTLKGGLAQWEQEFNNTFIGSQNTLISPSVLSSMTYEEPKLIQGGSRVFEFSRPLEKYFISVDVAHGIGLDYSVTTVLNISELPYSVCSVFRSNAINVLELPIIIQNIAEYYNQAPVMIELNDQGQQVANILQNDLNYPNMVFTSRSNKEKITKLGRVKQGDGTNSNGLKTTITTKRTGCSLLKRLIETNQLKLNDYDIISELANFIFTGNSYASEKGFHDDIVMTLVNFSWATSFTNFNDFTRGVSIRDKLIQANTSGPQSLIIQSDVMDDGEDDEFSKYGYTRREFEFFFPRQ